ncbi:MAG: DMT family transporter [Clostridium sp.]|uniref:DMT family transporter n=1 Tax=Clostridium sp. TaxID=1506 RepID=UPI0039ED6CE0
MEQISRKKMSIYLLFLVFVWGINWPLSKYALSFSPPLLFAGLRTLGGGLILMIFASNRVEMLKFKEMWPIYVTSSILNIVLFYGLQSVGLHYMPSGLFSAIVFLQPVLLGMFSWLWLGEKMHTLKALGLLLGFAGVAVMSSNGIRQGASILGILLAFATALSWTFGTIYIKKSWEKVDSIWLTAMQLTIGGIIMLGFGGRFESWSSIIWNRSFVYDTLFLSLFVIAMGWLIYFKLISTGDVSKIASYTFLIPFISILCSVFFLNERININLIVGFLLVISSIVFVNYKAT